MANREHDARDNNQTKHDEKRKSRHLFLGAVLGGMVGAAAALLLAPKSGKELRTKLSDQAANLLDKKGELAALTKEKAAALTKMVIQQSTDLVQKAKNLSTTPEETSEEAETNYITIEDPQTKKADDQKSNDAATLSEIELRKKLEETQKALDDEENKMKH